MQPELAVDLKRDDRAAALELLLSVEEWDKPAGRGYLVAPVSGHPLLAGCRRAYFLRVAPGCDIHPHTDSAADVFDTDLIVVETNKQCRNYWQIENNTHSMHLELGKRYRMVARHITHWAVNGGATDRVHLLIEYAK